MRKNRDLLFKRFATRLTELNNYLPFFPGLSAAKVMDSKEPKEIILHAVPNSWVKQTYIQGWDFERIPYKETCTSFEPMNIVEANYEGVATSEHNQWGEADHDSSFKG